MAQQIRESRPGSREQGAKVRIIARHAGDEAKISWAAAGPNLVEAVGGTLRAGVESHHRVRRVDLIYIFDPAHGDLVRETQAYGIESPLQAGTVEQDVRTAVEREAFQ